MCWYCDGPGDAVGLCRACFARRLEERDAFFSKLKADMERAVQQNRRPAIVIAHSMGNLVLQYFMAWLEATQPRTWRAWIDRHLWCYVGLGAPLLGAVGALKPTLTGETFGLSISEAQVSGWGVYT